jgi:hypothetical protein
MRITRLSCNDKIRILNDTINNSETNPDLSIQRKPWFCLVNPIHTRSEIYNAVIKKVTSTPEMSWMDLGRLTLVDLGLYIQNHHIGRPDRRNEYLLEIKSAILTRNAGKLNPDYREGLRDAINTQFSRYREDVLAAVRQNGRALQYASAELRGNRDFILAAVTQNGYALEFASAKLRADREVVLAAVRQNGYALQDASAELRGNRDFILAAVRQNRYALQFASDQLRGNRDFILAAVTQNGYALQYASRALRGNRGVVLAAVRQNGRALQFASAELSADRGFVLAAVAQNGEALPFAPQFQGDREVVLAAIRQNGLALQYASRELRADMAVVLAAVKQNGRALKFALGGLWQDREFVLDIVANYSDIENMEDILETSYMRNDIIIEAMALIEKALEITVEDIGYSTPTDKNSYTAYFMSGRYLQFKNIGKDNKLTIRHVTRAFIKQNGILNGRRVCFVNGEDVLDGAESVNILLDGGVNIVLLDPE